MVKAKAEALLTMLPFIVALPCAAYGHMSLPKHCMALKAEKRMQNWIAAEATITRLTRIDASHGNSVHIHKIWYTFTDAEGMSREGKTWFSGGKETDYVQSGHIGILYDPECPEHVFADPDMKEIGLKDRDGALRPRRSILIRHIIDVMIVLASLIGAIVLEAKYSGLTAPGGCIFIYAIFASVFLLYGYFRSRKFLTALRKD